MKIGYARVSTADQELGRQVQALKKYGCKIIFEEKGSGAKKDRPELDKMLAKLRPGDVVVIQKLDRLGRSLRHLIDLLEIFRKSEVGFVSLSDSFDTTTSQGKLLFNIMGAIAEFERDLISERTKDGLKFAKSKGVKLGKRAGLSEKAQNTAMAAEGFYLKENLSVSEICRKLKIGRSTFYRYMEYRGVVIGSKS
jgi:DNA invertase Pin-like site-specific DNA recombinase